MDALYYEKLDDGRVRCVLCPHHCVMAQGKTGICGVRMNSGGTLVLPYAGRISSLATDPIEKKPLYHFHPGTRILSVGFVGCSFHCPFCQNYTISQGTLASTRELPPAELVNIARRQNAGSIAYTYSEPTIHFEYVTETARIARKYGIRNVLVTNGFLNREPAREMCDFMDAANVDLKSFSPGFYRKEIGGELTAVLEFLRIASGRAHLEVTTLVIPGKNDSPEEIENIAKYISSLGQDIPLHLSAYYPTYRYDIPPTPPENLQELATLCRKHLRYVYPGNVPGASDTNCHECGQLLIHREGYEVSVSGIEEGHCRKCDTDLPIVGV